jgi:hypothetical protein
MGFVLVLSASLSSGSACSWRVAVGASSRLACVRGHTLTVQQMPTGCRPASSYTRERGGCYIRGMHSVALVPPSCAECAVCWSLAVAARQCSIRAECGVEGLVSLPSCSRRENVRCLLPSQRRPTMPCCCADGWHCTTSVCYWRGRGWDLSSTTVAEESRLYVHPSAVLVAPPQRRLLAAVRPYLVFMWRCMHTPILLHDPVFPCKAPSARHGTSWLPDVGR